MITRGVRKPDLPREEWYWFGSIPIVPGYHWAGATRVIDISGYNLLFDQDSIVINA